MVIAAYAFIQLLIGGKLISNSLQSLLVPACCYIVMTVSLNLTVGILGELSLGHAGFMSLGAFSGIVSSILLQDVIPSPLLRLAAAMVIGALAGALGGLVVGVPVLRLQGDYLAIVTLAFGQIIKNIIMVLYVGVDEKGLHMAVKADSFYLSDTGTVIIKGPMGAVGVTKLASFTAGFLLIMVTLLVVQNLVNSRAGRAIMALRDNRIAAESVGINVTKYKLMAFVISAAMAGAAGALFALGQNTITANKFDFNTSILILVFVVLGGQGNMWGSILAATFLTVLPETRAMRGLADYRMLVYAVVLILVMLATNNPTIQDFINTRFRRKKKKGGAAK